MTIASTWNDRELPILEAVWDAEERGELPDDNLIAERLGMEPAVVKRAVHSLVEAGFLQGIDDSSGAERFAHLSLRLRELGRRAIGQWPSKAADALLARLDDLIAAETDETDRTQLTQVRSTLTNVLKGGASGALSAAIVAAAAAAQGAV